MVRRNTKGNGRKHRKLELARVQFDKDTPVWIRKLVLKIHRLLIPEWEISVTMKNLDTLANFVSASRYLTGNIEFDRELIHNVDGRRAVIHELCHAFLQPMSSSVELFATLIDLKKGNLKDEQKFSPETMTLLKNYDDAEEIMVSKLSVLIESLI